MRTNKPIKGRIYRVTERAVLLCCAIILVVSCIPYDKNNFAILQDRGDFKNSHDVHTSRKPVKVVIVTHFELGDDEGDQPGEFQFWKTRRNLSERYEFPQSHHDLFYNPNSQILGIVTGMGTAKSASAIMALGLDQRFDLTKSYWLIAGIAGIDPEDASIGSVAWSSFLVDGDLGFEIDSREIPEDWETGFFPLFSKGPYDPNRPRPIGEVYQTNMGFRDWAFELSKNTDLKDTIELDETRDLYENFPYAQRPPFVLRGGHIAAMTFWHGKLKNDWANKWVSYWTGGMTDFVTSAMEDTGTYQSLAFLHNAGKVDKNRLLVLRAGSNYTMQPESRSAVENLLSEGDGDEYSGLEAALENLYRVGSVVIDELLVNWSLYENKIPTTESLHR